MTDLPSLADLYATDAGQPTTQVSQLPAADKALNLSPQERALYERHIANLWGPGGVDNADGSRSSLLQMNVGFKDQPGATYNFPTVWNGQKLDPDKAEEWQQILANVKGAGGREAFPAYATTGEAESRYDQMHGYMDKDTGTYLDIRRRAPMLPSTIADMFR